MKENLDSYQSLRVAKNGALSYVGSLIWFGYRAAARSPFPLFPFPDLGCMSTGKCPGVDWCVYRNDVQVER